MCPSRLYPTREYPSPWAPLNDGDSATWREGPASCGKTKDLGVKILKVEQLFNFLVLQFSASFLL